MNEMDLSKYVKVEKWIDDQVWDDKSIWMDITTISKLPKWMRILGFNIKYEYKVLPFPPVKFYTESHSDTYNNDFAVLELPIVEETSVLDLPTEITEIQFCWLDVVIKRYKI